MQLQNDPHKIPRLPHNPFVSSPTPPLWDHLQSTAAHPPHINPTGENTMFTATKHKAPCIITAGSASMGRWCYTHSAPADSPANDCAGPTLADPWRDGPAMVPTADDVGSPAYDAGFAAIITHALATDSIEHEHAGPAQSALVRAPNASDDWSLKTMSTGA